MPTQNWNQMYTLATIGTEHEYYFSSSACQSMREVRRRMDAEGFDYVDVKPDGTNGVDVEIVFPPLPLVPEVRAEYSRFMAVCVSLGLKYRERCGLHVHIGKRRLKPATDIAAYIAHAKERFKGNQRLPDSSWFMEDGMHFELIKDVFRRYSIAQSDINAILPRDRQSSSGMVKEISRFTATPEAREALNNCTTLRELQSLITSNGGNLKYWAINTGIEGTIEFRQHPASTSSHKVWAWCQFVVDLFEYSDAHRLSYDLTSTPQDVQQIVTTPEAPYRRNSNMDIIWRACRIEGGAPVRQLMNLTGWDADTIRPRISEMRSAHGQDAILTHTQQSYNHRYGDSGGRYDLGGYEVLTEYTRTMAVSASSDVGLLPVEDRADINIWGNLPHDIVSYYQRASQRHNGVVGERWNA